MSILNSNCILNESDNSILSDKDIISNEPFQLNSEDYICKQKNDYDFMKECLSATINDDTRFDDIENVDKCHKYHF